MKYLYPIRLLLLPLLLLLSFVAKAQIYPVQITVQAIPPYPIYLSDFTQGSSDRLRVQLLLTDVNVQNRRVRLKMSLNGAGIQVANPDIVEGALPINLAGGIPEYLNNGDLKPYFNPQNLPGLNPVAYTQPLPEGVYTLCFEAFDFITGQVLSKKSCYTMALIQNDPPQLSMPRNGEGVTMQNPQSVLFQWTPRHINATNVSYEFTLLELLDTAINPQAAIQVMQPYYQTTSYSTSLWLGPADAPLTMGRKYVWRVRAKSLSGMDELGVFKNNGYSEAWTFTYMDGNCNAPMGLLATDIAKRSVKVQWMSLPANFDGSDITYRISYRPRNGVDRWYDRQTTGTELSIFDLDPQTEYEFRVGRLCGGTGYVYGSSVYATTAAATDSNVVTHCGLPPANVDISNQTPLANLQSGETFTAGDFVVTALQVNGAGGSYTGEGFIIVPYLANAKVMVKFSNIFINSERKLARGFVESTYDPTMSGIADMDGLFEGGSGTGTAVTGNVVTNYQTNFPIGGPEDIKVTDQDDNPIITIGNTTNGGGSGLTIRPDSLPVSVADNNGDIYTVEPGVNGGAPVITKAGEQVPLHMSPAQLNQLASNKGKVVFAKASNTKYAFDDYKPEYGASVLWQKEYESLGNEYRVAAKATLPGQPDKIKAIVTLSDNTLKPDSVQFVTSKSTRYTSKHLSGNEYEVMLVGSAANDAQELFAVYPLPVNTPSDSGQYISLGKLLVAGYEPATAKVVIVPVNGGAVDSAAIIAALNTTYNGIGIKWEVQIAEAWNDNSWDADQNGKLTVTGSSVWSVYTPEMNALNAAYKASHTLVNGAAYLFALPQAAEEGVAGDMPRGKRFGYLFSGSNGKTAAHEVGHGLFALKHTFDNTYGFGASAMANNVMSYGSGLELNKLQWDAVHAPGLVIGMFEGDEDGQSATVNNIEQLSKFKNDDGSYTFISIAGKPITLKGKLTQVQFVTSEDQWEVSNDFFPLGALIGFKLDNNLYVARKEVNSDNFLGYKKITDAASNEYYLDSLSFKKKYKNVLAGIPCYKEGNIIFKVFPTTYISIIKVDGNIVEVSNRGEGIEKPEMFLADYLKDESTAVEVYAQLDKPLSEAQLFFLDKYADNNMSICGANALQMFKAAYYVEKYRDLFNCLQDAEADTKAAISQSVINGLYNNGSSLSATDRVIHPPLEAGFINAEFESKNKGKDFYKYLNLVLKNYYESFSNKKASFNDLSDKDINDVVTFFDVSKARGRTCLLRNIPYALREKLIEKYSTWTLSTDKESLLVDLVETLPDNDIPKLFTYLKANNNTKLWALYNEINGGNIDRFASVISTFILSQTTIPDSLRQWPNVIEQPNPNKQTNFLFLANDETVYYNSQSLNFNSTASRSGGGITIYCNSIYSEPKDGYKTYVRKFDGDPFQLVRIRFISDYRFPLLGSNEKIAKDKEMVVPAFWAYWLIKRQQTIENWKYVRVVADGVAVVASVMTVEPGPLLIVDGIIGGVDIGFQIAEERIRTSNSPDLNTALDYWDNLYNVYGAVLLGRTAITGGYKIWIKSPEIWQAMKTAPAKTLAFATELKTLINNLPKYSAVSVPLRNRMTAFLMSSYLEIKIANFTTLTGGTNLLVKNGRLIAQAAGTEVQIATVVESSTGMLQFSGLRQYKQSLGKVASIEGKFTQIYNVEKGLIKDYELVKLADGTVWVREISADLASYPNIRKYLGDAWVQQYLNVSNTQLSAFENTIRTASPDVLKYMNQMDVYDFAEMVRGYRDLLNNNKLSTFQNAIKTTEGFYGTHGWFNYWKLTPGLKYSIATIEDLRAANKLLPTGNATELQLASLQAFTVKGDYINIPMRYNKSYLGEFAERGYNNVIECLDELRKIPMRRVTDVTVFSGKVYSRANFELSFVGGVNKLHPFPSFISSSKLESVAEGFIELTKQWAGEGENIAVIQRIVSKDGVYIDDISDWGGNLGQIRHSSADISIQVQKEVLLTPSDLKQVTEPIPIMENGVQKTIYGLKAYYVDFIQIPK